MQVPTNLVYRSLRMVESFGLQGCTAGDFASKRYARRATGAQRNGPAMRLLGQLARAGYVLRIGHGAEAVHHLSDHGRRYLSEAHALATEKANEARAQAIGTYYGQGMGYGGGNR